MPYRCDLRYGKPTALSLYKAHTVCFIRRLQPTYKRYEKREMCLYNNGQPTRRMSATTEMAGQADIWKVRYHPS